MTVDPYPILNYVFQHSSRMLTVSFIYIIPIYNNNLYDDIKDNFNILYIILKKYQQILDYSKYRLFIYIMELKLLLTFVKLS